MKLKGLVHRLLRGAEPSKEDQHRKQTIASLSEDNERSLLRLESLADAKQAANVELRRQNRQVH